MAKNKLSVRTIDTCKPDAEQLLGDGDGLYLRVRPYDGGWLRDWQYIYSLGGRRRKKGLGPYPTVSLSAARDAAGEARRLVIEGIDPIEHDSQLQAELKARMSGETPTTVRQLFARWELAYLMVEHKDQGAYVAGILNHHVLPVLGDLALSALRRSNIANLLDSMRAKGLARSCGVVLSRLRQMFVWAVTRDFMAGDPTSGLNQKDWQGKANKRQRYLPAAELAALAKQLPASGLPPKSVAAVWLILACTTRVGETLKAKIEDVDFEMGRWRIPAENQKMTPTPPHDHYIDLSPFALQQLTAIRDEAIRKREKNDTWNPDGWLFPNRAGTAPVGEKVLTQTLVDRQRKRPARVGKTTKIDSLILPGGHWTVHDLRRSSATLMGELGVHSDVIERCLNHLAESELMQTYQLQELRGPMRDAWLELGKKLEVLTA